MLNRRGFLHGVLGLCAGLPFVGRLVPKPPVTQVYDVLAPQDDGVLVFGGGDTIWFVKTSSTSAAEAEMEWVRIG